MYVVISNGCWQWIGSYDKSNGYGIIVNRKREYAHRWIWRQHRGKIPIGLEVHHQCGNRGCVNPDHLELLTKGQHASLHRKGKFVRNNYCKRGHEMTENNIFYCTNGKRTCLQCKRMHEKSRYIIPQRKVKYGQGGPAMVSMA
jgi:hypothetical protein